MFGASRILFGRLQLAAKPAWKTVSRANILSRGFSSQPFTANQTLAIPKATIASLGVGLGAVGCSVYWSQANQIKNDVGGKLRYEELSFGSMCGLLAGVVAGKLSSVFVFLSLSLYLSIQFLQNRGIIHVSFKKYIRIGSQLIDVREMIFEQPSFNISFFLTFLLAAYYV